jgi:HEAT repeat protein
MTTRRHIARPSLVASAIAWLALAGAAQSALAQTPGKSPAPAAAAAPVSLDAILKQVALYDGGIESAAAWQLRDYVYARKDDAAGRAECEAKLLAFLKSPASPAARTIASRHLRLIASDTAVPALQAMLTDDKSADLALYALQGITGAPAERALVQSLGVAAGGTKIAIVAALGERRSADAVPALVPLLQQAALAPAAAVALGRIGGEAAASALLSAYGGAASALKATLAGALLEAAAGFEPGNQSLPIYEKLASDEALPEAQRRAALIGRIRSSDPRQAVIAMLTSRDPLAREAAIARVSFAFSPDTIGKVCAALPGLPDNAQAQLIAALSAYPGDCIVPAFLAAAGSGSEAVRLAALKGIGEIGGAQSAGFLAERAAATGGAEQSAARAALGSLKGRAVDDEIVAQLNRKPADKLAGELLLAVGDRRVYPAKPVVSAALSSPSATVRLQALKALRTIGTPSDIPAVLDALLDGSEESDRAEAEKTVASLAQKIENQDGRSGTVKSRLSGEKRSEARVRLVALLPLIADASALPVLRALAGDEDVEVRDAAVHALASWPTPAAREDLLKLARESRNQTNRLLAIGGLVRVIGLEKYRDPQAAVADLAEAAALSWRPEEQKLILGAVAKFPCQAALDLANGFLKEPDVKAEAQSAVKTIAARLKKEAIAK